MMKLVSYVLNPLILPTLLYAVLFYFAPLTIQPFPSEKYPILLAVISLTTFLIPILSILMLKYTRNVGSILMENRLERPRPFVFISIFYLLNCFMFYRMDQLNEVFIWVLFSITFTVVLVTGITFFWKISVHSVAMAGGIGILFGIHQKFPLSQLTIPISLAVLLTGLVMTSRLSLKAHRYDEVYLGALFGFLFNYSFIYLIV